MVTATSRNEIFRFSRCKSPREQGEGAAVFKQQPGAIRTCKHVQRTHGCCNTTLPTNRSMWKICGKYELTRQKWENTPREAWKWIQTIDGDQNKLWFACMPWRQNQKHFYDWNQPASATWGVGGGNTKLKSSRIALCIAMCNVNSILSYDLLMVDPDTVNYLKHFVI